MKKRFTVHILLAIGLTLVFLLPHGLAGAQNLDQACAIDNQSALCVEHVRAEGGGASRGLYGPDSLLTRAANLVSIVTGVVGVVTLMIGAFRYIRSSGDPSKTSEAQSTIIYAIIGLIVAASGRLLVVFVLNKV